MTNPDDPVESTGVAFDRVYVPKQDESQIMELIRTAMDNGFQCLEYVEIKTEEQILSLATRKNYAIVLQKVGTDLSISDKPMSQVKKYLTDKDAKIYSAENAIKWIKTTVKNTK